MVHNMAQEIRAFIVCVDYAPILAETLPYNKHHFQDIVVVTAPKDKDTINLCHAEKVNCFITDDFYKYGAKFNKWLALENALEYYKKCGWLWMLDADIFIPKQITLNLEIGKLYGPHRRMALSFLPENQWSECEYPKNIRDFNGYSQIFHAQDPSIKEWYQLDWSHAGGADTFFQLQWSHENKIRPNFEVLHVGAPGINWAGIDNRAWLKLIRSYRTPNYHHERITLPNNTKLPTNG